MKATGRKYLTAAVAIRFLFKGGLGVNVDGKHVSECFLKAGSRDCPEAHYMTGYSYFYGYLRELNQVL